jgi:ribonuclease E
MLIDGNHPEEIRVVITDGNRLDEYDIETSTKTQLKGNIYLAKITRVEPSLQAAFVDYGGNRHGFLAFSEIHPDYFQIPVEDREALFADEAELENMAQAAQAHVDDIDGGIEHPEDLDRHDDDRHDDELPDHSDDEHEDGAAGRGEDGADGEAIAADAAPEPSVAAAADEDADDEDRDEDRDEDEDGHSDEEDAQGDEEAVEGEDGGEARRGRRNARGSGGRTPNKRRQMRRYKIQEVIKRRQILLVQVVKEERGNKGAALTTYLSLAGRYCVLMPNAARGGGVSRKITSSTDRRRLKELLNSLEVPDGMGVIMRTAGMERNKAEIKRDFDYLMRVWEEVRETTLTSAAPALVYEEGNLIKRAIRDLYSRDIDEVMVEGADAYQAAKKLMRLMMPSHAKRVQQYRDPTIPLLHRFQVETQLEAMHNPVVQLKSGGYIVLNPTEALVAIDVNSGKSTRERNIEETAYKTNLEAASEIARQLRLRDLAGLIVIDFIDMEEGRNQRAVEKRFKEAVKTDRARIQLGRISPFGLFEMSRQRLRPSLMETSTRVCPLCEGAGHVRSTESTAVHVLRNIEEEGIRKRSSEIAVSVPTEIALYILNQKRASLADIERRYGFRVNVLGDDSLIPPDMRLERLKARVAQPGDETVAEIHEAEAVTEVEDEDEDEQEKQEKKEAAPRSRRRGRRRGRRRDGTDAGDDVRETAPASDEAEDDAEPAEDSARPVAVEGEAGEEGEEKRPRRRRRGRRGGRRRGPPTDGAAAEFAKDEAVAQAGEDDEAGAGAEPYEPEPSEAAPEPAEAEAEFARAPDAEAAPAPAREQEPEPEPEPVPESEPVHAEAGNGPNGKDRPEAPEAPQGGVAPETIAEPSPQPSRRGWWQRLID